MIELPAALAPWAAQLAALPTELALALAPWVGRLALAMGPLSAVQSRRTGEPDGYSGLSRRGSYERLVLGEWAVAELFPEEFLRRASAGEHLFLDLARREPRGALHSVAIVSAGPAQLGAPRLAHLAALIVLARRAAAAGAGFSWGVLEDRSHRLRDQLDEAAIRAWLAARTAVAAEREAIAAWLTAIGGDATGEVWFIGAANDVIAARRAGAASLVVRDLLEPHGRALEVEIDRRGPRARLRLELPAPELCARLLRDPYAGGAGSRTVPASGRAGGVRFAPGGRRLLVQLADGAVEAWPIPSSPRDTPGKPRRWAPREDHVVVALGIGRRSVLAATATRDDPSVLELGNGNGNAVRVVLPEPAAAALSARLAAAVLPPAGTCGFVRLRAHAGPELVIDVAGHLVFVDAGLHPWPPPGTELTAHSLNVDGSGGFPTVVATAFYGASIVWAERRDHGPIRLVEATAHGNRTFATLGSSATSAVWFGFTSPPQGASWGVAAVARDDVSWTIVAPDLAITRTSAAPVVGVRLQGAVPALLTQPYPHRLAWLERDHRELLPQAASPIVATAVCPLRPQVAWVAEDGEAVVYSMQHEAVVLRRVPEGVQ